MAATWRASLRIGFSLALVLLLCAAGAPPARAQGDLIRVDAQGPVDIRADQVEYDEQTKTYLAKGEVEITRGDARLMGDVVRLDSQTLVAEATGRVRLSSPGQVLTGKRLVVDLNNNTGKLYNGQIFVRTANYYLRGQEIEKTGKYTYRMEHGRFTTCDGLNPAWEVDGQEMEVTLEGYGTSKNTTFRIKDWPVIWFPYLVFPAKLKRQSGLLPFAIGSSSRDGITISQPYFQTLGDDMDATMYVTYMSSRGWDLGLEYRYELAPGSKGMFMIDYIPKDEKGQTLFEDGTNAKPYDSRYWFRAKADQRLFNDTMDMKVDIDLVSDQDYLREFTFGKSGFDASDDRFIKMFGRQMDPNTSLERQSKINFLRTWSSATFNGSLLYYDRLDTDNKNTLQQLPQLSLDVTRQAVGKTGLYFQMNSAYNYYYREDGSTGNVSDLSPQISMPLNFNDFLEIEPSFTYQPRLYAVTLDNGESSGNQQQGLSNLWTAGLSASTYLYRVYDFGSAESPFKIKHGFRPNISYSFSPASDEDDIASLARRNRGRTNYISYGVDNSFTYKVMGQDEQTGEVRPIYREFMRLNLSHSFDLAQYRENKDQQYWGEVTGRLEFNPIDRLYAEAESGWNLYDNTFSYLNALVQARDVRGDYVSVDYRQTHDSVHQVSTTLNMALTKAWSLRYIWRTDLKTEQDFESTYEVVYEGQCWGIRAFYTDNIREQAYFIAFTLGGFGEIFGWGKATQAQ